MTRDVEDGHTRINNEILEALATSDLNGAELRCVLYLLRKTYGWKKKADRISFGQWSEGTGLAKRSVRRALKSLVDKRILIQDDSKYVNGWQFNKYFEQWKTRDQIDPTLNQTRDQIDPKTRDQIDPKTRDQIDPHKRKERKKERESVNFEDNRIITDAAPMPNPTPTKKQTTIAGTDIRRFKNGLIPEGTGTNAVEVYRECFDVSQKLTQYQRRQISALDDGLNINRWRDTVQFWASSGYRHNNINGLLDRYAKASDDTQTTSGELNFEIV